MPVNFPPMRPTNRRYTPGSFGVTSSRTMNGRVVPRPLTSMDGGAVLELAFDNISELEVLALQDTWSAAYGTFDEITLPDEVWSGDAELNTYANVARLAPMAWRFSGDIEIEWVKPGRANARLRFRQHFRSSNEGSTPPVGDNVVPPPIQYPKITPSEFVLFFGQFPVAAHGWQGVWTSPTIVGTSQTDMRLELGYRNITNAQAIEFLFAFRETKGNVLTLEKPLPSELFAGIDNPLIVDRVRNPLGLQWVFGEIPSYEAVKSGRATVRVSLRAELR